jgi:hypothetical protein
MFRRLLVVLLLAVSLHAQERVSVVSPKTHPCEEGVFFVRAHAQGFPADWVIVVFCDSASYKSAEKDWKIGKNLGAFSIITAKRTYLLYEPHSKVDERFKLVIWLLDHELKHIQCKCDLGER